MAGAYGPEGTSVELSIVAGQPNPYKEGTQIARGIRSSNPLEARGIDSMRELAVEVRDVVGDATKTAVILAHAMLKSGGEAVEHGFSPKNVTRSMERAIENAREFLISDAKSPKAEELRKVARTAAGGDDYLASLVVEALRRVGKDGIVTVEETTDVRSSLSTVEGITFHTGYLSEHFVNSPEQQECVLDNCYILANERKISLMNSLLPILEGVARTGSPLLVIAQDVEGEALSTLVVNKLRGTLSCCAVKIPGYGDRRKALLEDIAIVTGAKAFTEDLGISLESAELADLGTAKKVIVKKEETTIVDGGGSQAAIDGRASAIRKQLQEVSSDFDRAKLQERLANLVGGVAFLRAGGVTSSDVREERYKIQSALVAAISTIEEGFVLGGGKRFSVQARG
jgi:chaperonin GroEL